MNLSLVVCRVVTCRGPALDLVDLSVTRAPTRRSAPAGHVLAELRVAARQVNR